MRYGVKRSLRNLNDRGILAGPTKIFDIIAKKTVDGQEIPRDGRFYYRGIDVEKLVAGASKEGRFDSEETAYLFLLGRLPNAAELESFKNQLAYYRTLPDNFVQDVILKAPSQDITNFLIRSVLNLTSCDERCDDISLSSTIRRCLQLIALFPVLSVYGYQAHTYKSGDSLYIHIPQPELSTAEGILSLLRSDSSHSFWGIHVLNICLTLRAEYGGGNNSTFTTYVITSSGTDIYSCMAAALASLEGPKHGDVNIKVTRVFEDMKEQMKDQRDEDEVRHYLQTSLDKQAFDWTGLTYGMGHAVYSLFDPRTNLLRSFVEKLSREKGRIEGYELYSLMGRLGPKIIVGERKMCKGVSASVDFYSGFIHHMLDLSLELCASLFAMAHTAGQSVHRIEGLVNMGKTIHPVYKYMGTHADYIPITER